MIDLCCIYVVCWGSVSEPSRLEQRWFASHLERELYVLRSRLALEARVQWHRVQSRTVSDESNG